MQPAPPSVQALDADEVLRLCREISSRARESDPSLPEFDAVSFLDGARLVAGLLKAHSKFRPRKLQEFLLGLHYLEGEFSREVEADPMLLYKPAHEVAAAFHSSTADIRAFFSGNRCSKTQCGIAEHYMVTTGQHRWRQFLPPPAATFMIGTNFSQYATAVFETKFLTNEPDNSLSPIFPDGGKWLHRYDDRKHVIYIACPECAKFRKAKSCRHSHSTIRLFSDEGGMEVLMGGQYNLGHFDELISEEFFSEAMQRLRTVRHSSFIITQTPLLGLNSWEWKRIIKKYNDPKTNKSPRDPGIPFVSVHTISQYNAGLMTPEQIEIGRMAMDPWEVEARIYGRFVAIAPHAIFDRYALDAMSKAVRTPLVGDLEPAPDTEANRDAAALALLEGRSGGAPPEFKEHLDGPLSIWETPQSSGQYIIGCDVAAGMVHGDYSCAAVLRIPSMKVVAIYHGHINALDYAEKLADLGRFYNWGMLAVERTGGLGTATLTRLKELAYWNLFRDLADPSQVVLAQDAVFGLDTNIRSKAHMVACLQKLVKERLIDIPCPLVIQEMVAFTQEPINNSTNVRLRGARGSHDDRVMALVLAAYVAVTYPQYDFSEHLDKLEKARNRTEQERYWDRLREDLQLDQGSQTM